MVHAFNIQRDGDKNVVFSEHLTGEKFYLSVFDPNPGRFRPDSTPDRFRPELTRAKKT